MTSSAASGRIWQDKHHKPNARCRVQHSSSSITENGLRTCHSSSWMVLLQETQQCCVTHHYSTSSAVSVQCWCYSSVDCLAAAMSTVRQYNCCHVPWQCGSGTWLLLATASAITASTLFNAHIQINGGYTEPLNKCIVNPASSNEDTETILPRCTMTAFS